jgi:hypothetical protein
MLRSILPRLHRHLSTSYYPSSSYSYASSYAASYSPYYSSSSYSSSSLSTAVSNKRRGRQLLASGIQWAGFNIYGGGCVRTTTSFSEHCIASSNHTLTDANYPGEGYNRNAQCNVTFTSSGVLNSIKFNIESYDYFELTGADNTPQMFPNNSNFPGDQIVDFPVAPASTLKWLSDVDNSAWDAAKGTLGWVVCLSFSPTLVPTAVPTLGPTDMPTFLPTDMPSLNPTDMPTLSPTGLPTPAPSLAPSFSPTLTPSALPTLLPTLEPTPLPTSDVDIAGGAIAMLQGGSLTVNETLFETNSAGLVGFLGSSFGGAVALFPTETKMVATFAASTFKQNKATAGKDAAQYGGGIAVLNSDMVAQMAGMRNFESPHTLTPLGGTRLTGDSSLANQTTLKIEGTEFLANEAEQGGAVFMMSDTQDKYNTLVVNGSYFFGNLWSAVHGMANTKMVVRGSRFVSSGIIDVAHTSKGGAIRNEDGTLDVETSSFKNNTAAYGGDIFQKSCEGGCKWAATGSSIASSSFSASSDGEDSSVKSRRGLLWHWDLVGSDAPTLLPTSYPVSRLGSRPPYPRTVLRGDPL